MALDLCLSYLPVLHKKTICVYGLTYTLNILLEGYITHHICALLLENLSSGFFILTTS